MKAADPFSMDVIRIIQDAIAASGMTNMEIIKKSGMSQDYFYTRMRGEKPFNTNDISYIADILGVDALDLLREAGERPASSRRAPATPTTQAGETVTVTGIDPSTMSEDEKVRFVLKKIKAGDQTLAAMTDPDKEREEEGGDGR
ncbi:hypothetical protein [Bifidobacterium favimelis]